MSSYGQVQATPTLPGGTLHCSWLRWGCVVLVGCMSVPCGPVPSASAGVTAAGTSAADQHCQVLLRFSSKCSHHRHQVVCVMCCMAAACLCSPNLVSFKACVTQGSVLLTPTWCVPAAVCVLPGTALLFVSSTPFPTLICRPGVSDYCAGVCRHVMFELQGC